jgi:hypothetical protein
MDAVPADRKHSQPAIRTPDSLLYLAMLLFPIA